MIDLKTLRKRHGVSQVDFASRLRVCVDTVHRWEKNPGRLTLDRLQDIASALECTVADLMGYDGEAQDKLAAVRGIINDIRS
jgi:transcriptional regulator with XRE-family HTH domain